MTDMFRAAPDRPATPGSTVLESLSDNLRLAASRGQIQVIKDLLAAGAGLGPDRDGRNALHFAAQEGHAEVCKFLAAQGCDVNMQDTMGYTPLLRSASQGAKDTVQVLLDSGCDINVQDEHGNAAIHEACWNGFSQTAELLVKYNCDVFLTNKAGFTALHLAAQNGHNESSRVLLYAGCNPDIKNNYGDTALHTAARYGHAGVARILISARCKLNEQNKNGDTVLHIAAALKRRKIAKILVESGIDTELLNKQNETAADVARRKEHPEIMLIISSYSVPRASSFHQLEGQQNNVTFKETVKFSDEIEACPEDHVHQQSEPKAEKQGKERKFFFFKKKKKDKEKVPPVTPVTSQKKTGSGHFHSNQGKSAVHGFFSQYVPRDGVQFYRDLAGNIKQGPIGYAPVCQCGPSLKRLEHSITDTRESLYNHIDASHHILSQRINNLDIKTKQQAYATDVMIQDRLSSERKACSARISERLQEERLETQAFFGKANTDMKEELEYWLNDKLASYGHCLDHHHDDSALPPRNLFFDFPTMGRLVRSRSDETLSASDYSGKFRKKDFYASRQAAMQQIRGWDVPNAESFSKQDRSRKRERNNNFIPNSNKVTTLAQVHSRESEKTWNDENKNENLSPITKSTVSPPTSSTVPASGQTGSSVDKFGTMGRSGNLPWKQTTHEIPQREYLSKAAFQPRVTFSKKVQQSSSYQHQHPDLADQPSQGNSYSNINPDIMVRQSFKTSPHGSNPGPQQRNRQQQAAPISQQSRSSHQNLIEGGPPNTDIKYSEQGGSQIPMLTGYTSYQDGYGTNYNQSRTFSADSLLYDENYLSQSHHHHISRCQSMENTLDVNDFKTSDIHASGYFTDSALRPSSAEKNYRYVESSQRMRSAHSTSPASYGSNRFHQPETSNSPKIQHTESSITSAFGTSPQSSRNALSKQVSSQTKSVGNMNALVNKPHDPTRKPVALKFQDISREFPQSKIQYRSQLGVNDIRNDTSPGFGSVDNHDPAVYSGRLDSRNKSESNLTSFKAHSIHFTPPVKECLQHESFVSTKTVPSPCYALGGKEESTCSSNQDSGYGSRNHGGEQRRGVDTSGGTPSSSFSMERSICNTPSYADSLYTPQGDFFKTGDRTIANDQSLSATESESEHRSSSNASNTKNIQSLPDSSRKPNLAQNITQQLNSGNRFSYNQGASVITSHLSADKQPQIDKNESNVGEYERQMSIHHLSISDRTSSLHQSSNSNSRPFHFGRDSYINPPQTLREQIYKPVASDYDNPSPNQTQTYQGLVKNSYRSSMSHNGGSNSQQQSLGSVPQAAVQAHIQGWYQRKLMEAAQRLRQTHSRQDATNSSDVDTSYNQRQNVITRTNAPVDQSNSSQQSHIIYKTSQFPTSNFHSQSSAQYGCRVQPQQTESQRPDTIFQNEYWPQKKCEHERTLQSQEVNSRVEPRYEWHSSSSAAQFQSVSDIYHQKAQNKPSAQVRIHNTVNYDLLKGSDV